ncbi:hypothetical protein AMECASPLE_036746 [Ameca splendens]|uniref:Secreted protein n=1 Tax=Ameca splendens TaxID=208324 RepID=A0ABV0ZSM8_9TELE
MKHCSLAKHFGVSFIRQHVMFALIKVFVPECICKLYSGFLCCFQSNGFFLSEFPFSPCWYMMGFTVDNDSSTILCSIFTRSEAFVQGLFHTFHTRTHSALEQRTCFFAEQYEE